MSYVTRTSGEGGVAERATNSTWVLMKGERGTLIPSEREREVALVTG
jgi:hypothetical protein